MAYKTTFVAIYDFIHIIHAMKLRQKMSFPYSMTVHGNLAWPDEISDINHTQEV